MDKFIPKPRTKQEQESIFNATTKKIQWYLKNLRQEAEIRGWTQRKYIGFKILKQKLIV